MILRIENRQRKVAVGAWRALLGDVLPRVLQAAPALAELPETEITVLFAGSRTMRRINRTTRGVDRPTDVLSYPALAMRDGKLLEAPTEGDYARSADGTRTLPLGEILIDPQAVISQAQAYGHSAEREAAFLAVHGALHLIGYDHDQASPSHAMRRWQRRILDEAGLARAMNRPD